MNLADSMGMDLQLCGRLCLVLAHSLWQFAILAGLAVAVSRSWKNATPELHYAIYGGALLLGLISLPITFALTRLPGESVALRDVAVAPRQEIKSGPDSHPAEQLPVQQAVPEPTMADGLPTSPAIAHVSHAANLLLWTPWLVAGYIVGVSIMLLRLLRGLWQNHRLSTTSSPVSSGPLDGILRDLVNRWSLRVAPALAMTERVIVPQVVGMWRPTILLPAAALTGLRPDELEMILAHELAHVRRYDLWANLVQRLAESALFFNPAVWYLSRRVSLYREYCCDEATCRLARHSAGDTRLRYAEALVRAVELTHGASHGQKLAALAASGRGPSELRRRVARLFGEPLREPVRISRTGLVAMLVGVAVLVMIPLARQNAAETESEYKPETETAKPTVEVVAIGTHDEQRQTWWNAEGNSLDPVPFTWKAEPGGVSKSDGLWRRVVIRIDGQIKNSPEDRVWEVVGARTYSGGTIDFAEKTETCTHLTRYYQLPDGATSFELRVGLAQDPWKTVARRNSGSIIFSQPISTTQGVDVVVSHNVNDKAYRVVAVDKQGVTHESVSSGGIGGGAVSQTRGTFPGLKIEDVDHFEFQTREYEWTEFKNLPVEPGEKVAKTPARSRLAVRQVSVLGARADIEKAQNDRRTNVMNWPAPGGSQTISWPSEETPLLTEGDIAEAAVVKSDIVDNRYDIRVRLKLESGEKFAQTTEKLLTANPSGVQLAIIFDKQVLMTPRLMSAIRDEIMISGQFDEAKAQEIAEKIKPGSTAKTESQKAARTMRVKVVDADGQPLQGVEIFQNHAFDEVGEPNQIENETFYSDESGEVAMPLSGETRTLRIWAGKPGFVPLFANWESVSQADGRQIPEQFEFILRKGTKIEGVVTNVAGIPTEGAKVEVVANIGSIPKPAQQQGGKRPGISSWLAYGDAGVVTDANGRWSLDNVPTDEELVLSDEESPHNTPLRLRFTHPDYETIDGINDWQEVGNPPLARLRDGSARTVMKWVDRDDHGRVNALRLEDGKQYKNANFSGRSFKGQEIIVWNDDMFAGAKLAGSRWEDTVVPGMAHLLHEANLSGAKLIGAHFTGLSSGMQKTNFSRAELESASLMGGVAGLQEAKFDKATIVNSDLVGGASAMQAATFRGARLQSSRLKGEGPALQMANFDDAQLISTTISCDSPTAFQGASLNNSNFIECDLSSITAEALASCKFESSTPPRYDAKTKFPAGFDPKEHGWTEIDELPVEPAEKIAVGASQKENPHEESRGLASEKVASLEELLASYEAMYERAEALHKRGLAGGEATKKWLALYHLSMTRAELAKARGETAKALQHYDKAVEAADEMIHSAQALHAAGRGTSESAIEGGVLRAKAKLAKIEAQERPQSQEPGEP